jgi:hypothetical protein
MTCLSIKEAIISFIPAVWQIRDTCPRSRTPDPDISPYPSRIPDPGSQTPEPKVTKEGSSTFSERYWFFWPQIVSKLSSIQVRDPGFRIWGTQTKTQTISVLDLGFRIQKEPDPRSHSQDPDPQHRIQGPPLPPPASMIPPPSHQKEEGGAPLQAGGGGKGLSVQKARRSGNDQEMSLALCPLGG